MVRHAPLPFLITLLLVTITTWSTLLVCTHALDIYTGLLNKKVERYIDLTTQLARHVVEVTIENTGPKSTQNYYLTLMNDFADNLSFFKVTQGDNHLLTQLEVLDTDSPRGEYVLYRLILKKPLEVGASLDLKIELVFTHTMTPFPSEITQSERQLVRYNDNHYWLSLYRTETVKTRIKLSSSSIQSNSELSPSSVKADTVSYGPYKDVHPLSHSPLSLHFENNKPFITVRHVQRWIEVSHWGNVAVEEQYKVTHDGAKLKGPFSRYDFQINAQANGQASVQILRHFLPGEARDVYYRDDIGNISTSALWPESPKQSFEMRPRFPLFGDWKTEFTVGYNIPLTLTTPPTPPSPPAYLATLASDSSHYVLTVPFMADWEAGIAVDTQVLKVVLPEGATYLSVDVPFEVETSFETTVTYLDVVSVGRPVVVITKKNLVNEHCVNFQVHYTFTKSSMFFEIVLLIGGFFSFFVAVIIVLRVELSITEDTKVSRFEDERVIKILEEIGQVYRQRDALHNQLTEALNSYIRNLDENTWNKEKKQIATQFNELKKKVSLDVIELSSKDGESVSRINEIEKKQAEKEALQLKLVNSLIAYKVKKTVTKTVHESEREPLTTQYEAKEAEIEGEVEDFLGL